LFVELKNDSAVSERRAISVRRSWFHRESISLGEIAVQTFAVVLGILLALGIDGWKKDRETHQNVADAMRAVNVEIAANRKDLQRQRDHLIGEQSALAADAKAHNDGAKRACYENTGWSGMGGPLLLDAAYQTAIATQAFSHLEFSRSQAIAASYGMQKSYLDYHGRIVDLVLRGTPSSEDFCAGLIGELANLAGTVDQTYAKALATLAPAAAP
jgi:hypothetical protein